MYHFKNIIIREITVSDAPEFFKLIKSGTLDFYRPTIQNICSTLEKVKERILFHKSIEPKLEIECFIYKKNSNSPIGIVSLQGIDYCNRIAELNFMMFIKPAGIYGLEAIVASLYLAFTKLKLDKIYFYVAENNRNFLNLLKKRGFKEEAVLKKEIVYENKRYDLYRFSIFPDDKNSPLWSNILKMIDFKEFEICPKKF
jgi:ribosomal-protein-alanine N-acetyltransferase